ncbi:MAG: LLM class flavin-dependent oxidoreductase [Candidatus Binataceae bacterium]|nr:LLM class flavin-dependent oxidoreductase [Candidatus Binataceae bacterium]
MKIGVFSVVDHYPQELPRTVGQYYAELLDSAQLAEEVGFDSFWIAEHHFHEYGAIPSPAVWMAAAAARTRKIRLGVGVSVLPFHNPITVAEEYAMVDVLSGGRLEFGAGSGYLKHEFGGYGVSLEEKHARFDEALEIIERAWSGERFSYRGRFNQIDNVQLQLQPVQQPRPPILIATLRHEAAREVGARGYPLLTIPYAQSPGLHQLTEMTAEFRAAWTAASHGDPSRTTLGCAVHTYVSSSAAEIEAHAKPSIERYVRTRLYATSRPYDVLQEKELIACGNPEQVTKVLKDYERAGFNTFLTIMDFGGMDHQAVMKSIKLFGREVLPAFRD